MDIEIKNFYALIFYTFISSFILGCVGIIAGLWAEKFDHMASVTNFLIIPLSFLSGTFYTIDNLPQFLQTISKCNPFFYMIDGFRYSFLEKSDGSIFVGSIYLTILAILLWFVSYLLYKKRIQNKIIIKMSALVKNYNRRKIAFKRGKGSFLYSTNGKKIFGFCSRYSS